MDEGRPRFVRGCVLAVLCTLLTVVGHRAGGGMLPDLVTLVVVVPPIAAVVVWVAGRARGLLATGAVLGAGQLSLHLVLTALHPMSGMGGSSMLGVHAAVTLVTAVAVRHADDAVTTVAAVLRRVVPRRLVPPPADRALPARPVPAPDLPARRARVLAAAHVRRGPPEWCR